ncbi:MAG: hypothetical protein ACREHV_04785 [Rhizomicrobium sp.]
MIDPSPSPHSDNQPDSRWPFLRDVLVLQLKLLIGNLHNFILIPATMGAAVLDLIFKSGRHGSRFYQVLDWGRRAEDAIGLYGALDRRDEGLKRDFTVDAVVARVEDVIVREYQKGGTAASMKKAIDHVLDHLHGKTGSDSPRARETVRGPVEQPVPPSGERTP